MRPNRVLSSCQTWGDDLPSRWIKMSRSKMLIRENLYLFFCQGLLHAHAFSHVDVHFTVEDN
ncbi:hypothetical protein F4819DRAFT_80157 [Hypoxylon fuscum]|nr:hypothetical protein F4819DRAFT_80157 [Hypoxylon fuscum]